MNVEEEKQLAAAAAAEMVETGMRVGLGTGSTVAYLLVELARRNLKAVHVATSPRTADAARALGIVVEPFNVLDRLDLCIDGADQISPNGWLIKGGGGAQTREKVVAASANRFIVIADSTKLVDHLHAPVPLELLAFGLESTLRLLGNTTLRDAEHSPDGGVICDYHGDVSDPATLAQWLSSTPGVIGHGLFAPGLVSEVLVGTGNTVQRSTSGGTK
jgi:ribose 5-phosphate isomerase A